MLLLVCIPVLDVSAQPTPTPNDTLISPEVLTDHKVIFRLYAPKASEVSLQGDWMMGSKEKMVKNNDGVWSLTVGPLKSDIYLYAFFLDGVAVVDPKNTVVKQGSPTQWTQSMVEVPGDEAKFLAIEPTVPHGIVGIINYYSSSLKMMRRMRVYTPPGYNASKDSYPVLYLISGGGCDETGWSTVGRADIILDNLLAQGKIKPMIVVMPDGHVPGYNIRIVAMQGADQDPFTKDMIQDIMPFIEKNYRVLAGKDNRAIAGLSMGGIQTLNIGLTNLDKFSYLGPFSTGWFPDDLKKIREKYQTLLSSPETRARLKLFWISSGGPKDVAYANGKAMMKMFDDFGIKYQYSEVEGGHYYNSWRKNLYDFSQLLFK